MQPYEPTPVCGKCNRKVSKRKAILCIKCNLYFHENCVTEFIENNYNITCSKCFENNEDLNNPAGLNIPTANESNNNELNNSNNKEFYDDCNAIQMPFGNDEHPMHINCKYYDTQSFNSIGSLKSYKFGALHLDISSLNKHFDKLSNLLSLINFTFPIIGLTEYKIGKHSPINNINIPGYQFCYNKTVSTHGGTGFYISDNLTFQKGDDLTIYKDFELESTFIKVKLQNKENVLFGCIYGHPKMSIADFIDY